MSWDALKWAKDQKIGKSSAKFTLIMLANYADESFTCYPGIEKLAEDMEIGESTVYGCIAYLEERGKIRVLQRWGKRGSRRSNRYQLLVFGEETPLPEAEDWQRIRDQRKPADPALDDDSSDMPPDSGGISEGIPPESGGMPDQDVQTSEIERFGQTSEIERSIPPASGGTYLQDPEVTSYKEENHQEEPPGVEPSDKNPPPLGDQVTTARENDSEAAEPPVASSSAGVVTGGGGDASQISPGLAALVGEVRAVRDDWVADSIVSAASAALSAGRAAPDIRLALLKAAGDRETMLPSRINNVAWWSKNMRADVPKAAPAGSERPMCRRPGHVGQFADSCVPCRGEQLGAADEDDDRPVDPEVEERGRRLAEQILGRRRAPATASA